MIKRKATWILAALLVIAVVFIHGYNNSNIKINPSYHTSSMHQIQIKHKDNNIVKWQLSSDKATFPTGKKTIYLDSVSIKINHSPEINIFGRHGIYEIEEDTVILSTDVELTIEDTVFSTDKLKLNNKENLITTETPVKYSGKNFLIEGTGLFAKIEEQEVKILNNVKAILYH